MSSARKIVLRTTGQQHGFIRRLVSPGDLGHHLKPFVFLDHVRGQVPKGAGFGFHPHSGIATLTYQLNADSAYEDTTGQNGLVEATGLEWMRAGGGTWHQGFIHPKEEQVEGFQLWVALPPIVEDGPSEGIYVNPAQVPQVGGVRVLLGEYAGAKNPIPVPSPIVYLDVVLAAGETWRYQPQPDEAVAWALVYRGRAQLCGEDISGELVVCDESSAAIEVTALQDSRFLFGCAKKHSHPLVLGSHSVHTNQQSLAKGVANIRAIGEQLRRAGRM